MSTTAKSRGRRRAARPAPEPPREREKVRVTCYLRLALWEEARSAALTLGAKGKQPHSLSALLDGALERELVRLRKLHRGGKSFGRYKAPLPGGRPRK